MSCPASRRIPAQTRALAIRACIPLAALAALAPTATAVELAGVRSATLEWAAASGPVDGYEVHVSRNGDSFRRQKDVQGRRATVSGSFGETIQVRVAAFARTASGRVRGPFSPNSVPIRFLAPETGEAVATGEVSFGRAWQRVALSGRAASPVVILGPPERPFRDAGAVRLQGVAANGFEIAFRDASGTRTSQTVSYLALERGRHWMPDGSVWEVGTISLSGVDQWRRQRFQSAFSAPPDVFLTVQTSHGMDPVVARTRNVSVESFDAALFEDSTGGDHLQETVGYLAIHAPKATGIANADGAETRYRIREFAGAMIALRRLVIDGHRFLQFSFFSDGLPLRPPFGNNGVLIADRASSTIFHVSAGTGRQRVVSFTPLRGGGFAVDARGGVFVTDPHRGSLARIDPRTSRRRTVSEGGRLKAPVGLALADGSVWVADRGASAVIRIDPGTGSQTVVSRGGNLASPASIAVTPDGRIFTADPAARAVFEIDPSTGAQRTVASGGSLIKPVSLCVDRGDLLVVDRGSHTLLRIDPDTRARSVLSSGGWLGEALSVAPTGDGTILVANGDADTPSLLRIDADSGAQAALATERRVIEPTAVIAVPEPSREALGIASLALLLLLRSRSRSPRARR